MVISPDKGISYSAVPVEMVMGLDEKEVSVTVMLGEVRDRTATGRTGETPAIGRTGATDVTVVIFAT